MLVCLLKVLYSLQTDFAEVAQLAMGGTILKDGLILFL